MKHNVLMPKYDINGNFIRGIRSFVCRDGRITKSQLIAIKRYWPIFGINFQLKKIDFKSIFLNSFPIVLEIGFGSGDSLVKSAIYHSHLNFVGIEVYKSGIGSCLNYAIASNIKNLKIVYHDAIEVIEHMITDQNLFLVQIFFPDPWNKRRHNKRRLLKYNFLKMIVKKLRIGGILHIMTDSHSYAVEILNNINCIKKNIKILKQNEIFNHCFFTSVTKFQKRGIILGNKIFDLRFQVL